MNETGKTALYVFGTFIVCAVIMIATAYSVGADPLDPGRRHIWALSLFAALYVSFRIVTVVRKLMRTTNLKDVDIPLVSTKEHDIDKRMAARKARVDAAKAKQKVQDGQAADDAPTYQNKDTSND